MVRFTPSKRPPAPGRGDREDDDETNNNNPTHTNNPGEQSPYDNGRDNNNDDNDDNHKNDNDDLPSQAKQANIFLPLSPAKYMKNADEVGGVQKMTTELPAQLKVYHVAYGLVTILAVDHYGSDLAAYSVPLQHACDSKPTYPNHDFCAKLMKDTHIIAYMPRRVSKEVNEHRQTMPNEKGVKFKQLYFILRLEDKSPKNVKKILETIKEFLNQEKVPVELCPKIDHTDFSRQSLDNYVEDKYVLRLQNQFFKLKTDDTFFEKSSQILRAAFFSPPYPLEAAVLGYPVVTPEDLSNDLDAEVADKGTPHAHKIVSPSKPGTGDETPICVD